jgi:hypothetical protein
MGIGVDEDSGEVWKVYRGFEEGGKGRCCTDDERTGKEKITPGTSEFRSYYSDCHSIAVFEMKMS